MSQEKSIKLVALTTAVVFPLSLLGAFLALPFGKSNPNMFDSKEGSSLQIHAELELSRGEQALAQDIFQKHLGHWNDGDIEVVFRNWNGRPYVKVKDALRELEEVKYSTGEVGWRLKYNHATKFWQTGTNVKMTEVGKARLLSRGKLPPRPPKTGSSNEPNSRTASSTTLRKLACRIKHEDISLGLHKRSKCYVTVTTSNPTKEEVCSLAKSITEDYRKNKHAFEVWIFFGSDIQSVKSGRWSCRTFWREPKDPFGVLGAPQELSDDRYEGLQVTWRGWLPTKNTDWVENEAAKPSSSEVVGHWPDASFLHFSILKKSGQYELWNEDPKTGRKKKYCALSEVPSDRGRRFNVIKRGFSDEYVIIRPDGVLELRDSAGLADSINPGRK